MPELGNFCVEMDLVKFSTLVFLLTLGILSTTVKGMTVLLNYLIRLEHYLETRKCFYYL